MIQGPRTISRPGGPAVARQLITEIIGDFQIDAVERFPAIWGRPPGAGLLHQSPRSLRLTFARFELVSIHPPDMTTSKSRAGSKPGDGETGITRHGQGDPQCVQRASGGVPLFEISADQEKRRHAGG